MRTRPSIPFLLELLRLAMRKEASAIYVVPWMPPTLRIDERPVPLSSANFTPEQSTLLVLDLLDEEQRAALNRSREIEFSFALDGVGRFSVHAFRRHGQPAMTVRPYALDVPTPRTLALPALACQAVMADRGLLVLASRSAALRRDAASALLEHRNRCGHGELALLEDATRCWHERARCHVHQGLTAAALDDLLRRRQQAADLGTPVPWAIAWGELRDGPQLERVVRAAERALCLVTLPADHLLGALQRLVSLAAEHTGHELLHRTAIHLHGLLALRPVPAARGGHELAATEALMNSPELAANLAEGDLDALRERLRSAAADAQPGFAAPTGPDEHLGQLLAQGLVTPEVALHQAVDRLRFQHRMASAEWHARPDAATAPVTVDTGFADLFDPASAAADPFEFARPAALPAAADTEFDGVDWAESGPSSPLALHPLPLAASAPQPHSLQFHAWTAPAVAAGRLATIDIWAARADQAGEVARLAASGALPPDEAAVVDEHTPHLMLQLRIDGVLSSPTALRRVWVGQPARVRFQVPVPRQALPGPHAARVRLTVGGLPIGELSFVLQVRPDAVADAALEDAQPVRRMLRSAYASYANEDRDTVQACVDQLRRLAPDLDIYIGAPQLRNAPGWRRRIELETGGRERLFLFWSQAAAESPWVDFEWRHLLRSRGPDAIDTVLLQPPRVAPLPAELADLSVTMLKPRPLPGTAADATLSATGTTPR
jgi:Tfp pilus assembly ATPase PilU